MEVLNDNSDRISFQNKNAKNDSFSLTDSSVMSNKSCTEEFLIKREKQEMQEDNDYKLEEINYIENEINYKKIIDDINPYLLLSFNDSDRDILHLIKYSEH